MLNSLCVVVNGDIITLYVLNGYVAPSLFVMQTPCNAKLVHYSVNLLYAQFLPRYCTEYMHVYMVCV